MATPLRIQLQQYGCDLSAPEFRDLLADIKAGMFPSWTDETLSYTRDEADEFCEVVRRRANCPSLPRVFILGSLNGIRKHSIKV